MEENNNPGDFKAFFMMLKSVRKGEYPAPWGMFAWVAFFGVYFISPVDLIPDYLFPILGFADDAALGIFTWSVVKKEVGKYKKSLENETTGGRK